MSSVEVWSYIESFNQFVRTWVDSTHFDPFNLQLSMRYRKPIPLKKVDVEDQTSPRGSVICRGRDYRNGKGKSGSHFTLKCRVTMGAKWMSGTGTAKPALDRPLTDIVNLTSGFASTL